MPCDMRPYGPTWPMFSALIRFQRAKSRCECYGQCGMHPAHRCAEIHHKKALWARGMVRLTVAHLCECSPPCQDANHVIAACQRCHLRIDRFKHAGNRLARWRTAWPFHPSALTGGSRAGVSGPYRN